MVAYAFYKVIHISRRWRDLTEMFRNISASALNSFCVCFFQTTNDEARVSLLLPLSPLATRAASRANSAYAAFDATSLFFLGPPRDMRGQGIWATLFDWCRDYFSEKEEWSKSVSEGFFFFFSFSKPDDTGVSQFGFIPW